MALHLSLQSFWNLLFLITDAFFRPYLAFQTSNQVTRSTIYYTAYLASMIKSDVCIHAPLLDIRLLGYKTSFTDQPNQSITHLCHFQSVVKEMQYTSEQWAHTNPEWFACLVCAANVHTGWCSTCAALVLAAQGWVIRAALELYKKSLIVKTIVQTAWFQRCSTTACAARADWTGALERGKRDVRFAASCHGPSASPSPRAVSLLCEKEGVWTSKRSQATLETETISKGSG